ncbi:unnamed protein product [Peronospora belbahrii]|uniref:Integrase catalytic domain-containing protein n=1 Tax=Peronospora belbahrii TaxID=622444 RepID=A0ABN8CL00_9STRA|nr:unnamed protein product [Peronospora belbahrii]
MEPSSEEVDDAMLDMNLLEINDDDVRQVNYRQTGKRKSRPNNNVVHSARPPTELAGANGTAERAIQTIVTIGRSLLHHAKLDKWFWAEAAMTAIYVKNRLPSLKISDMTPFEIVCQSKPSVKHMRVVGCQAYILTSSEKHLKWDSKTRVGISWDMKKCQGHIECSMSKLDKW